MRVRIYSFQWRFSEDLSMMTNIYPRKSVALSFHAYLPRWPTILGITECVRVIYPLRTDSRVK